MKFLLYHNCNYIQEASPKMRFGDLGTTQLQSQPEIPATLPACRYMWGLIKIMPQYTIIQTPKGPIILINPHVCLRLEVARAGSLT